MRKTFTLTAVGLLILAMPGCGAAVFVGGAIQPASTIRGSITSAQLGTVAGTVGTIQVTFVTFLQNGAKTTIAFCNNQINQFPLNQTVSVNFNPGQFCATIVLVTVVP